MTTAISDVVRRILRRDTMLMLAHDAEQLMVVVRNQDRQEAALAGDGTQLFQLAVDRVLAQADAPRPPDGTDHEWSFRGRGSDHAATLLRFCDYLGIRLQTDRDIDGLYQKAVAEVRPGRADQPALDRFAEVTFTHRRVRSLRAGGRPDDALRLASSLGPGFFFGSGAEPTIADVHFELGASLIEMGHPTQVRHAIGELERTYYQSTGASVFSNRHRHGYILGVAEFASGAIAKAAVRLDDARSHLEEYGLADTRHEMYALSLTLALAEMLALQTNGGDRDRAVELAEQSLNQAERIRGRWGVIARAKTPLALAFRRVCGDQALLAAALPGIGAARLGLRVCLSAKQTGFASHMRAGELLLHGPLKGLVSDVLSAERLEPLDYATDGQALLEQRNRRTERLETLRRRIERAVTPMLADTILPTAKDLDEVLRVLADRHALDYARLPDTLNGEPTWFRTHVEPGGSLTFEAFPLGEHLTGYFEVRDGVPPWIDRLDKATRENQPNWTELAAEVLPAGLIERLGRASVETPIELVISAHERLGLLPWAALGIDARGTRLVHHAVLTQTPVLTCLSAPGPPVVSGPALVRLVSRVEGGVRIADESRAWGLAYADEVPLSRGTLAGGAAVPTPYERITDALAERVDGWGFVHVAAHGAGSGLGQYLSLPEEVATDGQLPAAHALVLRWPDSALMATCHLGRLINPADEEPLSFVTAVLTAGSRCVVAAVDAVPDLVAGHIAARLVDAVRTGRARLDQALRLAQLPYVADNVPTWALFNAYVR